MQTPGAVCVGVLGSMKVRATFIKIEGWGDFGHYPTAETMDRNATITVATFYLQ